MRIHRHYPRPPIPILAPITSDCPMKPPSKPQHPPPPTPFVRTVMARNAPTEAPVTVEIRNAIVTSNARTRRTKSAALASITSDKSTRLVDATDIAIVRIAQTNPTFASIKDAIRVYSAARKPTVFPPASPKCRSATINWIAGTPTMKWPIIVRVFGLRIIENPCLWTLTGVRLPKDCFIGDDDQECGNSK